MIRVLKKGVTKNDKKTKRDKQDHKPADSCRL